LLIDTGGIQSDFTHRARKTLETDMRVVFNANSLQAAIEYHVKLAIEESDVVIIVVDGQLGLTDLDITFTRWLRRSHAQKSLVLAVNKCDNIANAYSMASSFYELGLDPIPISAVNGFSCMDLMYRVLESLPEKHSDHHTLVNETPLTVTVIGRPNVGKSSLINTILGEERTIISEVSGTTRDSVRTEFIGVEGRLFRLVDTAGIRKKKSLHSSSDRAEVISVNLAFKAIKEADVVVIVLDVNDGSTLQDYRLSEKITKVGKACVIAINKWDSISDRSTFLLSRIKSKTIAQLRPIKWANVIFTSAKSGQGVKALMQAVVEADIERKRRLNTASLNHILSEFKVHLTSSSPRESRTRARIYFGAQVGACPPTFILFVNDVKMFSNEFKKMIEKHIRINIGFAGTPIILLYRGKTN
jgi:GTP-binding protein